MSDQRLFQARLDGSEPFHEVLPTITAQQKAQVIELFCKLPVSDHPQSEPFINHLMLLIQQHRDLREAERRRLAARNTHEAAKKIQKQSHALKVLLQQLTPQQQQAFNAPLQIDLYLHGELTPEKTPWNPQGDFSVDVMSDITPYFQELTKDLERVERLCEYVKGYPLAAGRAKKVGPEHFAKALAETYQSHFHAKPATTRDGPYEQLVSFTGELAGYVVDFWHRYLLH